MTNPLADIPLEELQTWEDELILAEELAAAQQALAGYQLLDAALTVVEAMPRTVWQPHLADLYRSALDLFCQVHGIDAPPQAFSGVPAGDASAAARSRTAPSVNAAAPPAPATSAE